MFTSHVMWDSDFCRKPCCNFLTHGPHASYNSPRSRVFSPALSFITTVTNYSLQHLKLQWYALHNESFTSHDLIILPSLQKLVERAERVERHLLMAASRCPAHPVLVSNSPSVVSTACSKRATTHSVLVPVHPVSSSVSIFPRTWRLTRSPQFTWPLSSNTWQPKSSNLPATPRVTTKSNVLYLATSSSPSGTMRSWTNFSAMLWFLRAVLCHSSNPRYVPLCSPDVHVSLSD